MSTFRKFDLNQEPLAYEFIRLGIKGLDQLFGGGIPYNQLVLIEEDECGVYTNLLLRSVSSFILHENINLTYFSDGVPTDANSFVQKLPVQCKVGNKFTEGPSDMQIAFRYNHMPQLDLETGFITDFGRLIDERTCDRINLNRLSVYPMNKIFPVMESLISKSVTYQGTNQSGSVLSNLIIFDHLSALTSPNLTQDNICTFIYQLKCFARKLNKGAIIITIQTGWLPIVTTKRLRNISDSAIQLEAFDTLKPSVYSDDYKGALHVHKVTRVSSAKDSIVANLGFQLRKNNRHFVIEKLFLPPDIGETPSRVQPAKSSNVSDDMF